MAEYMGWQKYLHIRKETTWGTKAGGNPDIYIPYAEYSVASAVQSSQAALFTGVRQRRHNRVVKGTVQGNLNCPLYGYHVSSKSIAEYMIEWATSGDASPFLDSYTAELHDANNDNKRHLGLRVNQMTLAGDSDSGVISISLALIGKDETGGITSPTLSATNPQPVEFLMDDAAFYLSDDVNASSASGTGEALPLRSFNLTVNNNLQVYHVNDFWPAHVVAGVREIGFQFSLFKTANTYDALRRTSAVTNRACRLVLKGRHLGTGASGNFTQVEVHMDRLNFANASDQAALNELAQQNVDWITLKPDTNSNDVDFYYSLVA